MAWVKVGDLKNWVFKSTTDAFLNSPPTTIARCVTLIITTPDPLPAK